MRYLQYSYHNTQRRFSLFIVLEGIDGCGKTTAAELIKDFLENCNYDVVIASPVRETVVGLAVRKMLMSHEFNIQPPNVKLMLMAATHEVCIDEVVKPALAKGQIVVMDRYFPTFLAYQGDGALAVEHADVLCEKLPLDVVFYLNVEVDVTLERMKKRNVELEDLENVPVAEMTLRKRRYQEIFERYPVKRFFEIDANKSLDEVKVQIQTALASLIL